MSAWLFIWQPAIRPLWHVPLVSVLTGFHCTSKYVSPCINNLHLHDRGSVGSLTSVRRTLGVHSMANSVKNAGAVTRFGRNAQAEEPMLERFSLSDWLKWLPLGIRGCGGLRITDVTDSGLIICSRHSDSVDGAKKSKLEKKKKEGALGRERGYLHYAPHSTIWTAPGTGNKVWAKIELYKLVSYTKKNYQHNKIAFG